VTVAAVVAAVVVAAFAAAYLLTRRELYRTLDATLIRQARQLQLTAKSGPLTPSSQCRFLGAPACSQVLSPGGSTEGGVLPTSAATRQVAEHRGSAFFSDITIDGYPARMYTAPIGDSSAVQVALRSDPTRLSVDRIGTALSVLTGLGVLLSALLAYLIAQTGLRPVAQLTATAELISANADASHRIDHAGSDELGRLATAFNAMLARLEVALTAQRQLVADASHELRTPLTSIRTNATLLSRVDRLTPQEHNDVARGLDNSIEDMIGLVGDVIDLARGDEVLHHTEEVRLDTLIERSVNIAARHWPQVDFRSNLERAHVNGVPQRLDRLMANLLDNAAKFSSSDGVAVEITLTAAEDRVTITVRDHGPGIADSDLPRIFHRFYRAPHARGLPGSGLGLAIVDQIAHAHGGTISAANASDGGAVLTVELPTTRTASATHSRDRLH
jgi:two-component system sensor histidine kinase MprB